MKSRCRPRANPPPPGDGTFAAQLQRKPDGSGHDRRATCAVPGATLSATRGVQAGDIIEVREAWVRSHCHFRNKATDTSISVNLVQDGWTGVHIDNPTEP
jgi:hypothetical protein